MPPITLFSQRYLTLGTTCFGLLAIIRYIGLLKKTPRKINYNINFQ